MKSLFYVFLRAVLFTTIGVFAPDSKIVTFEIQPDQSVAQLPFLKRVLMIAKPWRAGEIEKLKNVAEVNRKQICPFYDSWIIDVTDGILLNSLQFVFQGELGLILEGLSGVNTEQIELLLKEKATDEMKNLKIIIKLDYVKKKENGSHVLRLNHEVRDVQ